MNADDPESRQLRASQRRATLQGRLVRLQDDLPPVGRTVRERLEMLSEISERSWALSGRPVPTWKREEMPGRMLRGGADE